MKSRPWIALLSAVVLLGLWSCLNEQDTTQSTVEWVQFKEISKVKTSEGCVNQQNDCAKVSVKYPIVASGKKEIQEKINKVTQQKIFESLAVFSEYNNKLVVNLDSAMAEFIALYEDYVTDSEFFTIPWELKIQGKVVFQSKNMVSLLLENSSYTGGAHPNLYTTLLNFNTNTGNLVELNDIVRDVNQFKNIAEDILLGKNKQKEDTDQPLIELTSESFFMLPQNFAIQEDGILLFYNPYEASDYANGSISFLISYDQLSAILSEEFKSID